MRKYLIILMIIILLISVNGYAQTGKKITDFDEATSMTNDDIFLIVDSPGSSPSTKKITRENIFKDYFPDTNIAILDANIQTSITSDDQFYVIDDPNGTPASNKITYGNVVSELATSLEAISNYIHAYKAYFPDYSETDQGVTGNGKTLKAYVDTIGSNYGTIILKHNLNDPNTVYTLTTSETIPSNITLKIEPGAYIDGNATLTINGPFESGLTKCFDPTGITIIMGNHIEKVYPQWWGAKVDNSTNDTVAVEAAIAAHSNIYFSSGNWKFNITITSSSNKIDGSGKAITVFKPYSNNPVIKIDSSAGSIQNNTFSNFSITGNTSYGSQDGINFTGSNVNDYVSMNNINIFNCGKDGLSINGRTIWSSFKDIVIAYSEEHGVYVNNNSVSSINIVLFENILSIANKKHGWRIIGDPNGVLFPNNFTFINCDGSNNGTGTNTTHGWWITNCRNFKWINIWCEGNGTGADGYGNDSCGIKLDGLYQLGHKIIGGWIGNHHYGIYIDGGASYVDIEIGGGIYILHNAGISYPQSGIYVKSTTTLDVLLGTINNQYSTQIDDNIDGQSNYHIHREQPKASAYKTITGGDTTPSVEHGNFFNTANGSSTTISDFDDGYRGQSIKVIIKDGNTTIDFTSSGLKGNAGADWSPSANDWMECIYDGTDWFCSVHDCTA